MTRVPDPPGLNERLKEAADRQPTVALCAHCPEWRAEGTAVEARDAATAHRKKHHPETFRGQLKRPSRKFLRRNMTKEREEEINEERRARIRALGLDIEVD